jgi:hypothetical protein
MEQLKEWSAQIDGLDICNVDLFVSFCLKESRCMSEMPVPLLFIKLETMVQKL